MRAYPLLAFIFATLFQLADATPVLLKPARVWTGNNNDPMHSDWVVLVDGEKIAAAAAPGGELRVWGTPRHEERVLPALRELLKLPFEHVIVSHGEPVHTRAAYERALTLVPWNG